MQQLFQAEGLRLAALRTAACHVNVEHHSLIHYVAVLTCIYQCLTGNKRWSISAELIECADAAGLALVSTRRAPEPLRRQVKTEANSKTSMACNLRGSRRCVCGLALVMATHSEWLDWSAVWRTLVSAELMLTERALSRWLFLCAPDLGAARHHCRARARTSGYRARMATPAGRKVLAARKKRGRHVLCPANLKKPNKKR
jgi:ribosomal protein L34